MAVKIAVFAWNQVEPDLSFKCRFTIMSHFLIISVQLNSVQGCFCFQLFSVSFLSLYKEAFVAFVLNHLGFHSYSCLQSQRFLWQVELQFPIWTQVHKIIWSFSLADRWNIPESGPLACTHLFLLPTPTPHNTPFIFMCIQDTSRISLECKNVEKHVLWIFYMLFVILILISDTNSFL